MFVAAVARSRALDYPWLAPPATRGRSTAGSSACGRDRHRRQVAFLVLADGELAGYVNVSEIVRGAFDNAYLGYAAFVPWAGRGIMRHGLGLVVRRCFAPEAAGGLGLHGVEANVEPGNEPSRALARALGFRLEGASPRYLHIDGAWRDHDVTRRPPRSGPRAEGRQAPVSSSSGGIRKRSSG